MTLYEEIGGDATLLVAVPNFYARLLMDPVLAPHFRNVHIGLLSCQQLRFLSQLLGGPHHYHGRSLAVAHQRLEITPEQFESVVRHLGDALLATGVPPELVDRVADRIRPLRDHLVQCR